MTHCSIWRATIFEPVDFKPGFPAPKVFMGEYYMVILKCRTMFARDSVLDSRFKSAPTPLDALIANLFTQAIDMAMLALSLTCLINGSRARLIS